MGRKIIILGLVALMLSIGGAVFAQTTVTLDQAISYGVNEIVTRLEPGAKVIVLNFNSPSQRLSNYVLDEVASLLARNASLSVIAKENVDFVVRELSFLRSGDIRDEAAQSIGRILGAQYIVSGSIEEYNSNYVVQFKTMPVEPVALQTLTRVGVRKDAQTADLMGAVTSTQMGSSTRTGTGTSALNNKLVLSVGVGGYGKIEFMNVLLQEASISIDPSTYFGAPLFFNAEIMNYLLVDLTAFYLHGSYMGINADAFGASFSLFGQYPIRLNDRFTLSPLLGIGYEMFITAKVEDVDDWASRKDGLSELDSLYAKPGVDMSINLIDNLSFKARFLYDFKLYSGSEISISDLLQHGPSLMLGVSYTFLRN